jgi:hypothetical protein
MRLIRGSRIFFLLNLDTHVMYPGMQLAWIFFFANLICLLFSIFTNDTNKVIFITNNIISPINNSIQTYI